MLPPKNEPKGLGKMLAKALLNDLANYTYFAPVVWNAFGFSLMYDLNDLTLSLPNSSCVFFPTK